MFFVCVFIRLLHVYYGFQVIGVVYFACIYCFLARSSAQPTSLRTADGGQLISSRGITKEGHPAWVHGATFGLRGYGGFVNQSPPMFVPSRFL